VTDDVWRIRFETVFFGNSAAMAIAHQSDLKLVDVNQRWEQMFGVTRQEAIGRTVQSLGLISEAEAKVRVADHARHTKGHEAEIVVRTRAGEQRIVLASSRPIAIEEGNCILTTLIDITARKHAEAAFAVAFNASPAGMTLVAVDTNTVIAANQRMLELTQYSSEELVGQHTSALRVLEPTHEVLLEEIARTGRLRDHEVKLARRDGTGVWTLVSTELVRLVDATHRVSVFIDISDRKRHERRLLTQHAVGRRLAEGRDTSVLPSVIEGVCRGEAWDCGALWLQDVDGMLVCHGTWHHLGTVPQYESAMHGLVPRTSGGIVAQVLASGQIDALLLASSTHPLAIAAHAAGMRTIVAFPILRGSSVIGVAQITAREERTLDADDRALLDSIGQMIGLFIERANAEAKLRKLNLELEDRIQSRTQDLENSNRDLETFASSVSHDLRAPLRSIQGFSQVMLEDYDAILPAEAKATLGRIHASGVRLRTLIDQLLSFARLGRGRLSRETIDLDAMVRSVVDELTAGREQRLELVLHPLGTCHADPTLLRTVWMNLVDNALKYSRDRPTIRIEIGCEEQRGEVVYFVRDNGVGFDMARVDQLFGVFQRLHAATEFEGTGIGLANVRRIVERHHGRVGATSVVGEGSRFEFTIGRD
jgi:PAS domain S-box-containing protein